jgi:hypothetical protein
MRDVGRLFAGLAAQMFAGQEELRARHIKHVNKPRVVPRVQLTRTLPGGLVNIMGSTTLRASRPRSGCTIEVVIGHVSDYQDARTLR